MAGVIRAGLRGWEMMLDKGLTGTFSSAYSIPTSSHFPVF